MRNINIFNSDLFPFLEGEELKDTTLTLTIKGIRPEKMKNQQGHEETKEVLLFQETSKGFVLNKTNAKRLAKMFGKMTGNWAGQQITLCTEKVQAFGETHNALRVIENAPSANGNMSLAKLLDLLKKVEVEGMATFYNEPDDIKACRAKSTPLPEPDDTDGWRNLFTDARDYAIDRISEAVERGDLMPGEQAPMPLTTAVEAAAVESAMPGQYFGEKDYGPKSPDTAMDQIEAEDEMDKGEERAWRDGIEADRANEIAEEAY